MGVFWGRLLCGLVLVLFYSILFYIYIYILFLYTRAKLIKLLKLAGSIYNGCRHCALGNWVTVSDDILNCVSSRARGVWFNSCSAF